MGGFLLFAALGAACDRDNDPASNTTSTASASGGPLKGAFSEPDLLKLEKDDGQWVMPAKNYASTRYSALDEINAGNAGRLKVAWTFSTGVVAGHEAAPLVIGTTMFVVTPFPNLVYALDLSQPGAPMKWKYDPQTLSAAQGRGVLRYRSTVARRTRTVRSSSTRSTAGPSRSTPPPARRNGSPGSATSTRARRSRWRRSSRTGKVIVGNSGGEFGVRGWLVALDGATGKLAWKAYATGPDKDVLIGPNFKPFYPQDRGTDLGIRTWPAEAWKTGGGTMWGWMSFDPETNLLLAGTANPGPWNPDQRPGDNKWTAGIFARDIDTGEARWFYQWSPHDLFDHDGVNENVLLDLDMNGTRRKVLVHPDRNGYMYVMDRTSGEVLSASPFAHITSSKGVDLKSGKLIPVEDKKTGANRVVRDICPSAPGAKDWQPSSFSPRTGLLYMPHNNLCMDFEGVDVSYIAGTPYVGANVRLQAGPGRQPGRAHGVGSRGRQSGLEDQGKISRRGAARSSTAGDLVFYGTMEGWFKAVNARTGQVAVAVQVRIGHHRPADHVSRSGRPPVRGGVQRHRRLAGRGGGQRSRHARSHRRARLGQGDGRPQDGHEPGGTLYVFSVEGK